LKWYGILNSGEDENVLTITVSPCTVPVVIREIHKDPVISVRVRLLYRMPIPGRHSVDQISDGPSLQAELEGTNQTAMNGLSWREWIRVRVPNGPESHACQQAHDGDQHVDVFLYFSFLERDEY
jgi:hypothetical protein